MIVRRLKDVLHVDRGNGRSRRLVFVFSPPLKGGETHSLDGAGPSSY